MTEKERYLYCVDYSIEGQRHTYFDYFLDRNDAEAFLEAFSAPHIHVNELKECKAGAHWLKKLWPYKESDWNNLYRDPETML